MTKKYLDFVGGGYDCDLNYYSVSNRWFYNSNLYYKKDTRLILDDFVDYNFYNHKYKNIDTTSLSDTVKDLTLGQTYLQLADILRKYPLATNIQYKNDLKGNQVHIVAFDLINPRFLGDKLLQAEFYVKMYKLSSNSIDNYQLALNILYNVCKDDLLDLACFERLVDSLANDIYKYPKYMDIRSDKTREYQEVIIIIPLVLKKEVLSNE